MRWTIETESERVFRESCWHQWFAWFPVQFSDGTWVWLEWVEKRNTCNVTTPEVYRGRCWEYREIHKES